MTAGKIVATILVFMAASTPLSYAQEQMKPDGVRVQPEDILIGLDAYVEVRLEMLRTLSRAFALEAYDIDTMNLSAECQGIVQGQSADDINKALSLAEAYYGLAMQLLAESYVPLMLRAQEDPSGLTEVEIADLPPSLGFKRVDPETGEASRDFQEPTGTIKIPALLLDQAERQRDLRALHERSASAYDRGETVVQYLPELQYAMLESLVFFGLMTGVLSEDDVALGDRPDLRKRFESDLSDGETTGMERFLSGMNYLERRTFVTLVGIYIRMTLDNGAAPDIVTIEKLGTEMDGLYTEVYQAEDATVIERLGAMMRGGEILNELAVMTGEALATAKAAE